MQDELDAEVFTCCKCKKQFDYTQGTWLPVASEKKRVIRKASRKKNELLVMLLLDHSPPEIITSPDFTCYDCCD